ncbi:hypothetical protein Tco_0661267 [Tanacetum coccineum]
MSSPVNLSRFLQELLESTSIYQSNAELCIIHLPRITRENSLIQSSISSPSTTTRLRNRTSNRERYRNICSRPYKLIHTQGIESDFDSEEDIIDNLLNDDPIPEYERLTFIMEPDEPVINNVESFNEEDVSTHWGIDPKFLKDSHVRVLLLIPVHLRSSGWESANWAGGSEEMYREVRIMQISQENGQSRTNTDTGKERVYKSQGFDSKKEQKSTQGSNDEEIFKGQDQMDKEQARDLEASFEGYQ